MSDDDRNTKNNFVVDVSSSDDDLEDLRALQKVKQEISKKKRALKDKDYLAKHPDLQQIVQDHRRRKVKKGKPNEDGKVPLEVTETKVKADLELKPIKKEKELDYDLLAEKVADKMKSNRRARRKDADIIPEEPPAKPDTPTEKFNKTLPKTEEPKAPPVPKLTIAQNGKWF
jgi:hypothetical protein